MREHNNFKDSWIAQMSGLLRLSNSVPDMSESELQTALSSIYDDNLKAPQVNIVNNYKGVSVQAPMDTVYNLILSNTCVLAGDATMFLQHSVQTSDMVPVIIKYQNDRDKEKQLAFTYEKGSPDYMFHNRNQANKKVVINALYGLFGYAKFRFFNINIAQSVTASGQLIISTATCCFENFLADNTKFVIYDECILFLDRMKKEYAAMEDKSIFKLIRPISKDDLVLRMYEHAYERYTHDEAETIIRCINELNDEEVQLAYYKNNIRAFHRVPYVKDLLQRIFDSIEHLQLGDLSAFDNPDKFNTVAEPGAKEMIEELIHLYDIFVLDTHQIFDRVRRTKYTPKKSVMYIDTDSNFVALEEFVEYFIETIPDKFNNRQSFIFKCTSILTMVVTHVIAATYKEFAASMNISPEYGKRIKMKNEFLFSILVFGTSKKRYFGKMIIQEGKMIKNGKGDIEVKGFDFKKASTKAEIYDKIVKIIFNTILDVNQITYKDVLRAANNFKANIKNDILAGSNLYYKQLSVSSPDKYKNPYIMQGVKGVLLWNAIVDKELRMEFPTEVDIIPIPLNKLGEKQFASLLESPVEFFANNANNPKCKVLYEFYKNHHTEFSRMISTMMEHPNIWKNFPSSIAKPRNMTDLPEWLKDIIDIDTIVHNNVNLINPILESIGIPIITEKLGPMYTTLTSI